MIPIRFILFYFFSDGPSDPGASISFTGIGKGKNRFRPDHKRGGKGRWAKNIFSYLFFECFQ